MITSDGTTAYVSNEGGRAAKQNDFQIYSAGTEIVADPGRLRDHRYCFGG